MAVAFINSATTDQGSGSSIAVNKPTNTAENDIMFALISSGNAGYSNSVPSGWTSLGQHTGAGSYRQELFYKVAGASEGGSYSWGFSTSNNQAKGTIATYRGGFKISDPINVVSNTEYVTVNTTWRAASMSVTSANSVLLFFASARETFAITFTKPSVPTTDWVEDYDGGAETCDIWHEICHMTWSGSGATGNMDATGSGNGDDDGKHAFAVALKVSSTNYPLTAALGTFTLTGVAASLKVGYKLLAALGTFTLTGVAAALKVGTKMLAALGTFTLTGVNATLLYGKLLVATLGEFVLTGSNAAITSTRKIAADLGTFTLTGINSILYVGHTLTAVLGEFILFGSSASLNGFRAMSAALGQFVLTGADVAFPRASKIFADVGAFTLTGISAAFSAGIKMVAAVGTFTLTGVAALFPRASKIFANTGTFILTGIDARGLLNGVSNLWVAASKTAVSTMANISKNAATWINRLKS